MNEKDTVKKYKNRFYIVSIVLVVIMCIQGLYWAGVLYEEEKPPVSENSERELSNSETAPSVKTGSEKEPSLSETDSSVKAGSEMKPSASEEDSSAKADSEKEPSASEEDSSATAGSLPDAASTKMAAAASTAESEEDGNAETSSGSLFYDGYNLEQVVVLSRHNIRSPFRGPSSAIYTNTPHEWFDWSSNSGELSLRGGALETMMGQYFRKWLEAEGFFPDNYHPTEEAVRIYANSKQRTIATAQFFTAGLLPTAREPIEYHAEYDTMDPVFTPQLTFVTDEYAEDVRAQIKEIFTEKVEGLEDNYELLTDVIDMEESEAWQDGTAGPLRTDDLEIVLKNNAEPAMTGSLKRACSISDAMILQYYEEPDKKKAAFGNDLSPEEWKAIGEIKDVYGDVLFTSPLVAPNTAHPLLQEIVSELNEDEREFTFLCGHDSNIGSVLAAIGSDDYVLPETIERKTPIGSKLVFCRWRGQDGSEKMSVSIVYQSSEQLRNRTLLDLENPPVVFPISLQGLDKNEDGLYDAQDVMNRLDQAIKEYDNLLEEYGVEELDNAA